MQGLRTEKKRKMALAKRKRNLLSRKNYRNLELHIRENSGKCSTYYVPVKVTVAKGRLSKRYMLQQSPKTSNTWKIVGRTTNIVVPEALVNKKISLKKGNISVEGIVLSAKPLKKGPEGNPVPTPPVLGGGSSSE